MPTLTWDDLAAIQREVPSVQYAAPQLRIDRADRQRGAELDHQRHRHDARLLRDPQLADGVGRDVRRRPTSTAATKVVVLGQTVVDKLFGPSADPVGQTVRIRNIPFQVVGVLARKGQSPMGQDYDDAVFIPSTTFMTKIQGGLQEVPAGHDHGQRALGGRDRDGAARRSRRCCATATTCARAPTTTSRSAT